MPDQKPVERTPFPAEAERERTSKPVSERPEFEGRSHVDPFDPHTRRDGATNTTANTEAPRGTYDAAGQPIPRESLPSSAPEGSIGVNGAVRDSRYRQRRDARQGPRRHERPAAFRIGSGPPAQAMDGVPVAVRGRAEGRSEVGRRAGG